MDAEFWLGNDNLHYITEQGITNVLYYSYCVKAQKLISIYYQVEHDNGRTLLSALVLYPQ